MELTQIRYFIEVAKREHVTEAAFALNVAQSAISRQIANLEGELGVQLFIREGRNVRLTPVGKMFLEHMENVMKEIEKAKQQIDEFLNPEEGTIRIGFPSSLASYTLPTVISAFRSQHPGIHFELRQGMIKNLIDSVLNAEIDMAFVTPVPTNDKELTGYILFTEQMTALLPASHPLSTETSLRLDQLRNEPFVLFRSGMFLRKIVDDACKQMGFQPKVAFEGEEIDTIKGLVAAGLGVTILPEITLIDNIPRASVRIPISEPVISRNVGIVVPNQRDLSPSEKLFLQFLIQFFARINRFNH
ncbi:transcriptional regulator (LysR family) [[Clostridium] ultunense Esp]|nr:transcriptional regulator (LysR family) [[Clostridium] ultunense Esp]